MRLLTGTSGYSYKEWKGSFYPDDLPAAKMLPFYAEHFRTVEINNTFYRMPKADTIRTWGAQVPDGFTFAIKASRRITHNARLRNAGDSLMFLCEQAAALGDKLGPLLFQLPPNLKVDVDRLREFLALMPANRRAAFEFRHPSWHDEPVFAALRDHNAALVTADTEADDRDAAQIVATADWGYLRLRRCDYTDDHLADWARRIAAQPWTDAYVYFKHEDEGTGPALAKRFEAMGT
jgi:uncharacterized protein YecE (DUF72 family)